MILTGHEDGAVRIWDLCDNNFQLIAKIETAHYFITDDEGEPEEEGICEALLIIELDFHFRGVAAIPEGRRV